MYRLQWAELRDSWSAWLGVCLTFVVTNFSLSLGALTLNSSVRALANGAFDEYDSTALIFNPALNLVFCAIVGSVAIGTATSLVLDSRRGSLARLALSGASPRQVVGTVMAQLILTSVVCSLVGNAVAYAVLQPTLAYLAFERDGNLPTPAAQYVPGPAVAATLLAVGVALLGGWKQARRGSRIPPVEALRQAQGSGDRSRMTISRWIGTGFLLLLVVGSYAAVPALTEVRTKETISNLLIISMVLLVVSAALLALIAPLVVGPLTRLWTTLIPRMGPTWDIARSNAVVKAPRLVKTVIPVMMAIGLLFGMLAISGTLVSTLAANGYNIKLSSAGVATLLVTMLLPLLISMSSGVGSLIMMSKQRDAELALSGIVGATPSQRIAMPILEGVIIAITGAIMGMVMAGISLAFLAIGIPAAGLVFAYSPNYLALAVILAFALTVTVLATLLPTLRGLRIPEPRMIARLVAE